MVHSLSLRRIQSRIYAALRRRVFDGQDTLIGHDVWIGHEAVVLPGVTVGNGAIIGARSVVSRDVPPFSVVAGNPARVVRQRFPDAVVDLLQQLSWWERNPDEIREMLPVLASADVGALRELSHAACAEFAPQLHPDDQKSQ
ncbi:CatB-related O-acetyltransferase [Actibacterium pelagium]|uniref:CatB-related O-acetyltransferase n=1 Tax=Actibacterium pelagium TaxID=2029103 RepID=UPI0022B8E37F|nr:CatB-related O-acetyltransferase [Actibacterium pelagium]